MALNTVSIHRNCAQLLSISSIYNCGHFDLQKFIWNEKAATWATKQYFDQNRGNLIFYVQKSITGITHDLIIKNFGNSPAKLLSLKITPDLDWKKAGQSNIDDFNISKLNNIFLAPQQHIGTIFDFSNFNETELNIEICYSTCGQTFTEQYKVDLNYLHKVLSLEPQIKDELSALKQINKSLTSLSDKFI